MEDSKELQEAVIAVKEIIRVNKELVHEGLGTGREYSYHALESLLGTGDYSIPIMRARDGSAEPLICEKEYGVAINLYTLSREDKAVKALKAQIQLLELHINEFAEGDTAAMRVLKARRAFLINSLRYD